MIGDLTPSIYPSFYNYRGIFSCKKFRFQVKWFFCSWSFKPLGSKGAQNKWAKPKPSLKIGSVNKTFLFWYWQQPKFFFRDKSFLFFKIESWNFQNLSEKEIHETSENFNPLNSFRHFFSIGCQIELKFCEILENSFSKNCWKVQLSKG